MPAIDDMPLTTHAGETVHPADYAGQVLLVVADAIGRFRALHDKYREEGFAVLAHAGGAEDETLLVGRDGEIVERFAPELGPDAPALVTAIERELFASE